MREKLFCLRVNITSYLVDATLAIDKVMLEISLSGGVFCYKRKHFFSAMPCYVK